MLDATVRRLGGLLLAAMLVTGCGSDDGAGVRNVDGNSGSGTGAGSGTGSGAGAASGPGSGTGSGTGSGAAGGGSAAAGACEPAGPAGAVEVTLDEWSIVPKAASAKAGAVGFTVRNAGADAHELLVVKAASPSGLPVRPDGSIDEARLDPGARAGEIGPVEAGKACAGTLNLTKGSYVLVCNIVEKAADGTTGAHYDKGMVNTFSVT